MNRTLLALIASLLAGNCLAAGCTNTPPVAATFTPVPSPTPLPPFPSPPVPPDTPDTGWAPLRTGLEQRIINVFDENGQRVEYLYIVRLEPQYYQFGVDYRPQPFSLQAWQDQTGALLVVNGGYYRRENETYLPNGLTVVNGQALGSTYEGFGGMLAVTDQGPEVRGLAQRPYAPGEPLQAAVQSFPLLVKPGGELGFPQELEDYKQARRTVIGQDRSGRILFILAPYGYFTLHRLSLYLTTIELDLDIALNLDGGTSTGLLLVAPRYEIPSYYPLPVVITVRAR